MLFGCAGITGLATALRLRQSGHRVTVVDKGVGPNEVCVFHHLFDCIPRLTIALDPQRKGGAHLPPNPTKLLMEWGFGKQLKRYALPVRAGTFLSGEFSCTCAINGITNISLAADDGHEIGRLEWREDVLQESGADYFVIQVS